MDSARVNPLTGPVFVEDAQPGDALVIEVLDFAPAGWGWTAIIPGFGLLAEEFPRDIQKGGVLRLPVEVPGALLSVGDTHAAQGDGEVCGTAIESAMTVTLRLTLEKKAAPRSVME